MSIKLEDIKVNEANRDQVMIEEFELSCCLLGQVCTARLLQGFYGAYEWQVYQIKTWLCLLGDRPEELGIERIELENASYIFYKPQLLVAITNSMQEDAARALTACGFTASKPANNLKYGEGRELITWTYALHGYKGE